MTAAALLSALGASDAAFLQPQPVQTDNVLGIPSNSTSFVLDSGCTAPLVASPDLLSDFRPTQAMEYPPFVTGTGDVCHVTGVGTLRMSLKTDTGITTFDIPQTRYCERFKINLMPEDHLVQQLGVQFTHDQHGKRMMFNSYFEKSVRTPLDGVSHMSTVYCRPIFVRSRKLFSPRLTCPT